MNTDRISFGNFIREKIKDAKLSQAEFYTTVGIRKPYFYDILSGKVNPPPPEIQYRMIKALALNEEQSRQLLNIAAEERDEVPADIVDLMSKLNLEDVRLALNNLLGEQSNSNFIGGIKKG